MAQHRGITIHVSWSTLQADIMHNKIMLSIYNLVSCDISKIVL